MSLENGIRIIVIGGSTRPGNYTNRAMAIVVDELRKHDDVDYEVVDPAGIELPPPSLPVSELSAGLRSTVEQATGVILCTPEYHGTFSSVMKLVIENLGFPSVLAGKPVGLVGVAAGQIGAIKALEHLRSVCSHIGALVLPGPVSVANVRDCFNDQGQCLDETVEKRLRGAASNLIDYIRGHICPRVALEEMVRKREQETT